MAGKFIELADAAKMLGVSEDDLNDMRLKGDIHALRDGSSWKFKADELERVAEDRGLSLGGMAGQPEEEELLDVGEMGAEEDSPTEIGRDDAMDDLLDGGESDLDLSLSEDEGGDIDPSAKTGVRISDDEEDLGMDLAAESDVDLSAADSASDVSLVPDDTGSEVNLVADESSEVPVGTDVNMEDGGGTGDLEFEGSDLGLDSDVSIGDDEEIALGDDEDDLTIGADEEISLDDDDELVLQSGSDITGGGAGDTGINLASPSDSGLNLEEEPLDLAGSSVSSLELPEDDDLIDLEDLDEGTAGVQADEDFQLAPSGEQLEDEEDSGSQVIALEDSEAFAEVAEEGVGEPVLGAVEEGDELETALEEPEGGSVTQPAMPEGAMLAAAPEVPYSIWNVLSLLGIVVVLSLTGMLMTDLVRNMWTWDEPYTASTPVMDLAVRMFGLDP
jgi:hypothetical protein